MWCNERFGFSHVARKCLSVEGRSEVERVGGQTVGMDLAIVRLLGMVGLGLVLAPVLGKGSSGGDKSSDGKEGELHVKRVWG